MCVIIAQKVKFMSFDFCRAIVTIKSFIIIVLYTVYILEGQCLLYNYQRSSVCMSLSFVATTLVKNANKFSLIFKSPPHFLRSPVLTRLLALSALR